MPRRCRSRGARVELNPLSVLPHMNLGIVHDFGGRHAESLAEFRRVVAMDPRFVRGHTFLSVQLMWAGEHEAAVDAARIALRPVDASIPCSR